jgi:hypothetical protein
MDRSATNFSSIQPIAGRYSTIDTHYQPGNAGLRTSMLPTMCYGCSREVLSLLPGQDAQFSELGSPDKEGLGSRDNVR